MGEALSLANVRDSNKPIEHFDFVRVNPDRSFTFYNARPREQNENSQKNLDEKRNQFNGYMSRATASRIKKMLHQWLGAMKIGLDHAQKTFGNKRRAVYYPRFLTLTIPDKQKETDQEFKRKYLERFIQELKRQCGVKYYFWKAEPQQNGNIHFHFIIDRYIDKHQVQKLWCHIIDPYVKAWQKKIGDSSRLPPATKIEKIRSFKKLGEYAVKYCLKDNKEDQRGIKGRIWGASRALKNLKGFEIYHDEVQRAQIQFELDQVQHYKLEYHSGDDYYTHIVLSAAAWKHMHVTRLKLTNHFKDMYQKLYQGRTLDYEKRVKREIMGTQYMFNRYIFTNEPRANLAAPVTL
jgi:hypothetical protein